MYIYMSRYIYAKVEKIQKPYAYRSTGLWNLEQFSSFISRQVSLCM